MMKRLFPIYKSNKILNYCENLLCYNLIFYLFFSSLFEISLYLALQWKYPAFNNAINIASFVFSIIYFGYMIFMFIWLKKVLDNIALIEHNSPSFDSSPIPISFKGFLNIFDHERKSSLYFPLINMAKKNIFCFMIVYLYFDVFFQILGIMILIFAGFIYKRIFMPMKKRHINIKQELNDFLSCFFYGFLLIISLRDQKGKDGYSLALGEVCVYLLITLTFLNVAYLIIEMITGLIKYLCKITPLSEKYLMLEQVRKIFLKYRGHQMVIEENYVIDGVRHQNIMATGVKERGNGVFE